jgi:hypothetical protein
LKPWRLPVSLFAAFSDCGLNRAHQRSLRLVFQLII